MTKRRVGREITLFEHRLLEILEAIQSLCTNNLAQFIAADLAANRCIGYTLELPEPIAFAVTAHLGELQVAEQEQYVPLIAQSVSKLSV